ncbi:hypothetical protein K8Q93_01805 [Candidatus Parcubacteria bacterium]|nr:hypothetical protein [Candidatus Parcubacteria bacterium]
MIYVLFLLFGFLIGAVGYFLSPWPGGSAHAAIWMCIAVIVAILTFLVLSLAFGENDDEELELETSPSTRDLPAASLPPTPPAQKKPVKNVADKIAESPATTTIARPEDLAPKEDSGSPKRGYSWDGSAASVGNSLKEFQRKYNSDGISTLLTGKLLDPTEGKCKLEGENGVTFTLESSEKNFKLEAHVTEKGVTIPLSETSRLKRFYAHEKVKDLNLAALQKIADEIKNSIR